jgi:hypothetical protein
MSSLAATDFAAWNVLSASSQRRLQMRNLIALAAIAAVLGLTPMIAPALAQTAEPQPNQQVAPDRQIKDEAMDQMAEMHGPGKHGRHHEGRRGGRMMRMIDANADGVIGEDEAAAMADRMFMRLDQNGDSAVDKAEFTTPRHRRGMRAWFGFGSDEAAAVQKVREEKFVSLDADKNGALTKVEFFAEAKAKLAAADTDKDGKVTPWEFRAAN